MKFHHKINQILKNLRVLMGKIIFDKKINFKEFNIENVNNILFLMYRDKIGDHILNTIMYREIKKNYPDVKISVLSGPLSAPILKNNPYIDNVELWEGNIIERFFLLLRIQKKNIDLLINLDDFSFFQSLFIVSRIFSQWNLGFNKEYYNLYNMNIKWDKNKFHESDKCIEVLNVLKIQKFSLKYDIFMSQDEVKFGHELWKNASLRVVLNFYGANKHRCFTQEKAREIILKIQESFPHAFLFLSSSPDKRNEVEKIASYFNSKNVQVPPKILTLRETVSLIGSSHLVITPETSLVHIACAFSIPQISIYRNKNTKYTWAPIDKNAKVLISGENDINDLNSDLIIEAMNEILILRK